MENNINEVLGVNENNVANASNEQENKSYTVQEGQSAEETLLVISSIILVVGLIATAICLFYLTFYRVDRWGEVSHDEFNPSGFATTVMVLVSTLISWATLRVFANISITLKEINKKIK